jgi:hypothetical protein
VAVVETHSLRACRAQLQRLQYRGQDVHEPLRPFQGLPKACRGRRNPTRDARPLDMDTFLDVT